MSVRTIPCPGVRDQRLHDAQWTPEHGGLLTCQVCGGIFTGVDVAAALVDQLEAFDAEFPALAEPPVSADEERLRRLADELLEHGVRARLVEWIVSAGALRLAAPHEVARRALETSARERLRRAA